MYTFSASCVIMCAETIKDTAGGGKMGNFIRRLSSSQIIILGFAAAILLGCLLLMLLISVFILTLSCILGWVVAKISLKLKK